MGMGTWVEGCVGRWNSPLRESQDGSPILQDAVVSKHSIGTVCIYSDCTSVIYSACTSVTCRNNARHSLQ